jgi:hypothetical protein
VAGYRIAAGTLLIAGEPVGPPELLDGLSAYARRHGLALGAVVAPRGSQAARGRAGVRRV